MVQVPARKLLPSVNLNYVEIVGTGERTLDRVLEETVHRLQAYLAAMSCEIFPLSESVTLRP